MAARILASLMSSTGLSNVATIVSVVESDASVSPAESISPCRAKAEKAQEHNSPKSIARCIMIFIVDDYMELMWNNHRRAGSFGDDSI
jgi:hypothetical protein